MAEIVLGTISVGGVGPLQSLTVHVTGHPVPQETLTAFDALVHACQKGDVLGNDGPFLLRCAAELLKRFAPPTAKELLAKADAEEAALKLAGVRRD
jgi:hypothetical protein